MQQKSATRRSDYRLLHNSASNLALGQLAAGFVLGMMFSQDH